LRNKENRQFQQNCTVELHLSGLNGTANHPDMQKIQIIGFFLKISYIGRLNFDKYYLQCGPGSVVGIATAYGLDGPGIEPRWGEIFRTSPDRP